jgi:hypothetical protein
VVASGEELLFLLGPGHGISTSRVGKSIAFHPFRHANV